MTDITLAYRHPRQGRAHLARYVRRITWDPLQAVSGVTALCGARLTAPEAVRVERTAPEDRCRHCFRGAA